jgi:hypothetical protein
VVLLFTIPFHSFYFKQMSSKFLSYLDSLSAEQQKSILLRLIPECASKIEADFPAAAVPVPTVAPAPVPTKEPAAKKARKATVKKSEMPKHLEEALLQPVDGDVPVGATVAAPAPAPAPAPTDPADPLKNHPSRLQKIDTTRCVARKITITKHVPGTHKDEGGVRKFFYEKQCTAKPTANGMCDACTKAEAEVAAGTKVTVQKWFGRLDAPMYEFAKVVGCKEFFELYPQGIKDDPLSVVPAGILPPPKVEEVASDEPLWLTCTYKHRPVVLNTKTNYVFELNPASSSESNIAALEKPIGKLVDAESTTAQTDMVTIRGTVSNKAIDPYDLPE